MAKIAVVNVNSFAKQHPEHIKELEENVGKVEIFNVDVNISSEDLAQLLQGFRYIVLGTTPKVTSVFFELQKDVKLITRHGIGFNHIDIECAKQKGVYVCKELGEIERDAVAEQALSLLAAVSKRLYTAHTMVLHDEWRKERDRLLGFQLTNKVTGIIGYGNIGSRFGEIMKYGFHNKVLAYDPNLTEIEAMEYGIELVSLEDLLKESDFVSIHANLTQEGKYIINQKTLSLMKKEAVLINTARGGFIDEVALAEALLNKRLGGFGADVLTQEPVQMNNPLLKQTNVVFSPHVGVYNDICLYNMDRKVMNDIYLMEKGEKPLEIVNGL